MLLQLKIIASTAVAHVDGQHTAYLGLLTPRWLSWRVSWLYVFVVVAQMMQTAVAISVVEEVVLSFVGVWERHGNVSLVQRLVLLMTTNLAG